MKNFKISWQASLFLAFLLLALSSPVFTGEEAIASETRLKRSALNSFDHSATVSRSRLTVAIPTANSGKRGRVLPAGVRSVQELFSTPAKTMPVRNALAPSVAAMFPARRLKRLDGHDLVVLVDKSSSMRTSDAPGGLSRWDWTERQLSTLSGQLGRLNRARLDVVLFDNGTREYTGVKMATLPAIFSQNRPGGGTNVTRALKGELNQFFDQWRGRTRPARPLLVAVITDGAPSSSRSLKDLIVNATHKINSSSDLRITFLQVGSENQGNKLIPELDHGLVQDGAKYDIVRSLSFPRLIQRGLVNALIDAVS